MLTWKLVNVREYKTVQTYKERGLVHLIKEEVGSLLTTSVKRMIGKYSSCSFLILAWVEESSMLIIHMGKKFFTKTSYLDVINHNDVNVLTFNPSFLTKPYSCNHLIKVRVKTNKPIKKTNKIYHTKKSH